MPINLAAYIEAAVLAFSLSIDAFTAGFAYGSKKITIPMRSVQVINMICAAMMGLALLCGAWLKPFLPEQLAVWLAFGILLTIGLSKLMDGLVKSVIRRHARINKQIKFSFFSMKFILNMYADPEDADADVSGSISPAEAAALAVSLSLDGIAVGFGASLVDVNGLAVVLWSLLSNMGAILLGRYVGHKAADKLPFNMAWCSGLVLILLAISKIWL